MIKAYGYLRVSGTGQVEGDGFDRQRELISRFADQAGIVIPRFYEERGISGSPRPESGSGRRTANARGEGLG